MSLSVLLQKNELKNVRRGKNEKHSVCQSFGLEAIHWQDGLYIFGNR